MELAFSMKNVTHRFPGFQLGPVNLELEPGYVLGFAGPNGSGKTTTMQCLTGLLRPDSGTATIFGQPVTNASPAWKRDIGYVGDVQVFYENWTGFKNLKFVSEFYPGWSDALARELAQRFVVPLDKRVRSMSKGNRIKLSLIAALAHQPKLLILDEPTAGLDPVVRSEVLDVLFDVLQDGQRSIFYATHILSDISRLADEMAFINAGQVLHKAAKQDLLDAWAWLTFSSKQQPDLPASVAVQGGEGQYRVLVSDLAVALAAAHTAGLKPVAQTPLSIEEIAVQILKEAHHVDHTKK